MQNFFDNFMSFLNEWGMKALTAIGILIVAYIIALIVKWLIGKAIDATGLAKKANTHNATGEKSLGASIGSAGFWIVMLIGIMQAMTALGATQVSDALNRVVDPIMNYGDNVIGAILIFGIFMILANVIKTAMKAIFAPTDVLPEKFGLAEGRTNVSGVLSTVLSAIVMILGAIAAFDVLDINAISEPANAVLNDIMTAIPRILIAGIILTVFVFIARFVSKLIKSTLPSFGIDRAIADIGILKGADGGMTATTVIANLSTFFITLLGLITAVNALGFDVLTVAFHEVLQMGAQIVFGAVIIFAGAFIANLVSSAMASAGTGATDAAAGVVKWVIIVLATILGISRMGLDPTGGEFILDVAKYGVMGAAAAMAIAFGWGGKDWAAKQLERFRPTQ